MNAAIHQFAGMQGLGGTADIAVSTATSVAEKYVPTAIGPTVAGLLGISVTAAIPIVGAAIAGISIAIEAIIHSGCGQTCVVTSQWANQAAEKLDQNISAYFAIPVPRPRSMQQMAMANFQAIWNTLVQQCNQPNLGDAGQNCINDRKDGACKWKAAPPAYPGEPAAGACWNWWNGYYYPIANDPNVYDDSAAAGISSVLGGIDPTMLIVLGAAGLLLVVALS